MLKILAQNWPLLALMAMPIAIVLSDVGAPAARRRRLLQEELDRTEARCCYHAGMFATFEYHYPTPSNGLWSATNDTMWGIKQAADHRLAADLLARRCDVLRQRLAVA